MAEQLVFGYQFDPIAVATMPADQLRYWYERAAERERKARAKP